MITAGPSDAGTRRASSWTAANRVAEHELLDQLTSVPPGSEEYREIRDVLVTMHQPLVEHLARRFRDRGESHEDLVQVGNIGLIKAVDRFDTDRGVEFSTYATPTIVGEIKRHFRDRGWAVRVPRRLQELRLRMNRATGELSQTLGRSPTARELAAYLDLTEEEVLEGLESAQAYATKSIDGAGAESEEIGALVGTLGGEDSALELVELRESLKPLLEALPEREKRILVRRFFDNWTQAEIAAEVGLSQMHVSRLLSRTLEALREQLTDDF